MRVMIDTNILNNLEAPAWEIPLPILESSKEPKQFKVELAEVKLGKEVVPASARAVTSSTISDLPIVSVGGGVTPGELKSYVELNQKLKAGTELTSQERVQYRLMQENWNRPVYYHPLPRQLRRAGLEHHTFPQPPTVPGVAFHHHFSRGNPLLLARSCRCI